MYQLEFEIILIKNKKDLKRKSAAFVINEKTKSSKLDNVDKKNYKDYFNTTDLDQGAIGKKYLIT